jgi:hypothetical protein
MNHQAKGQAVALVALQFTDKMTTADTLRALNSLYDLAHSDGRMDSILEAGKIVNRAFDRTAVLVPHGT